MGFIIEDGKGSGKKVEVDNNNRLSVKAYSESIQHVMSHQEGQAYQAIGTATLENGITPVLHITNNSADRDLVVTYIRHQIVSNSGGTAFPNVSNYFRLAIGRTYVSGGEEVTPVNINTNSGNEADVTAYNSGSVLEGTAIEIDRWYTKEAGDMNVFNKEGSLIIKRTGSLEMSYVGDHTDGIIYARISFIMIHPHD